MPLPPETLDKFKKATPVIEVVRPDEVVANEDLVRDHILLKLGKPPGYTRTIVRAVSSASYRVNVYAGPVITDSFFVTNLGDEILSNPAIVNRYPE